jgi:hypothetical protein
VTDPDPPSADRDPAPDVGGPVTLPPAANGNGNGNGHSDSHSDSHRDGHRDGHRDADGDGDGSSPSTAIAPGPAALDPDVVWVQAADALWRELPDAVVVLSPAGDDRREPLAISGPGAELWHVLAEPLTAAGAADALASVYDVDAETILGDLESVLAALVDAGVIVAAP